MKKIKRNRNKGITLIALVITIIVLIILAGVTMNMIIGQDGILNQAKRARKETNIAAVEEEASLIYADLSIQKSTGTREEVTLMDIINEMKKNHNFEIETRQVSSDAITGIEVSPKELKITENGTGKIRVKFLGAEDGYVYYAKIDGKYYQIRLTDRGVVIDREEKTLEGTTVTATLEVQTGYETSIVANTSISGNEITITGGTGSGTTTLTITYGEGNRDTCNVTIAPKATGITADALTIEERKEGQIETKIIPADAEVELSYSTTNTDKIIVDATTGKVKAKALASGLTSDTATITIIDAITGKIGTCTITIKEGESDWGEIAEIAQLITEGKAKGKNNETVTKDSNSEEATVELSSGESRTIQIGETYKVKYGDELLRVRVLGFMHDHLADENGYDEEDARAGISFEFMDFLGIHSMNPSNTNETGWGGSKMRTYLHGEEGIGKISETLRENIKEVVKPYLLGNTSEEVKTDCTDKLWLLSCSEIWTHSASGKGPGLSAGQEGDQYKYYAKYVGDSASDSGNDYTKKPVTLWWLRSPDCSRKTSFCGVFSDGSCGSSNAARTHHAAAGFSI